jgi:tetratricopeptide (TPR) repeat protein
VPESLPSKLIAAVPATKAGGAAATSVITYWPWIAGVALISIAASAVVYSRHMLWNSKPPAASKENAGARGPSTIGKDAPATSKAIQQYEQAVRFDPYNADAWFALAKAQAAAHRSEDALSSAEKALDVARSRNRSELAGTIQAWLRSYRAAQSSRPGP